MRTNEAGYVELTPLRAAILQLLPGVSNLVVYGVLAWLLVPRGVPAVVALGIAVLVAEVPLSWSIMIQVGRLEGRGSGWKGLFPWRRPPGWKAYLGLGLPAVVFSVIMVGAVTPTLGEPLRTTLFSWLPTWFVMAPPDPSQMSGDALPLMALTSIVAFTLVGGPTQELYSRGFLLPRTAHWGRWAPAFNALLFAVFHLIAPWSWPGFFLMTLAWSYLVWWRRSVQLGLVAHVGMLALQALGMTLLALGALPSPP